MKPYLNAFPTRKAGCIHSAQLLAQAPQSYRAGNLGGLVLALSQGQKVGWLLTLFSQSHIWPGLEVEMFQQGPYPNQTTLSHAHSLPTTAPHPCCRPASLPPLSRTAENCFGFSLWTLVKKQLSCNLSRKWLRTITTNTSQPPRKAAAQLPSGKQSALDRAQEKRICSQRFAPNTFPGALSLSVSELQIGLYFHLNLSGPSY